MPDLVIENVNTSIKGQLAPGDDVRNNEIHGFIRNELSYLVPGAKWSDKFKTGVWDGRISLYDRRNMRFPTGLVGRTANLLKLVGAEYRLIDARVRPKPNVVFRTIFDEYGREMRFYQEEASRLAYEKSRGVIVAATGSGKTFTAMDFIVRASVVPFVFIVPSISLLRQTHSEFKKYLRVGDDIPHIGFIGAGVCDVNSNGLNVITYQTAANAFDLSFDEKANKFKPDPLAGEYVRKSTQQLADDLAVARKNFREEYKKHYTAWEKERQGKAFIKYMARSMKAARKALYAAKSAVVNRRKNLANKAKVRELFLNAKGFIHDEAHIATETVEELAKKLPKAYYRVAQTATPWTEKNDQIRIEGTFGRPLIQISPSDLVHLGFSVPVNALGLRILADEDPEEKKNGLKKPYAQKYREFITDNWERNWRIKQAAEELKKMGIPTLIFVEKVDHGNILEDMIENSVFIPGSDKGEEDVSATERDYRRRILNSCEKNDVILIATQWVNVGIDAPKLGALIFAGTPKASGQIIQMTGRGSRCDGKNYEESCKNGKTELIVIYFVDKQKNMKAHSCALERTLKSEEAWKVRRVKA